MDLISIFSLFQVEEPVEDETLKSMAFYFPSFNFTIAAFSSPFLVKYESKLNTEFQVHLDILDEKWTSNYSKYNYVVIAAGQRYHKIKIVMLEDGKIIGCHICAGEEYWKTV